MSSQPSPTRRRQIVWPTVITVISAAILIGAEVFGAAFAGGWALAILLGLDDTGAHILQAVLFAIGVFVMATFIRAAQRVEVCVKHKTARRFPRNAYSPLKKLNVYSHSALLARRELRLQARVRQICDQPKKNVAKGTQNPYLQNCPLSHVPVVVCQSVGIRTRGRTAAKG